MTLTRQPVPISTDPQLRRMLELWNEELLRYFKLAEYSDNAAAIAAGLSKGDFYHTSGTVKVVI